MNFVDAEAICCEGEMAKEGRQSREHHVEKEVDRIFSFSLFQLRFFRSFRTLARRRISLRRMGTRLVLRLDEDVRRGCPLLSPA